MDRLKGDEESENKSNLFCCYELMLKMICVIEKFVFCCWLVFDVIVMVLLGFDWKVGYIIEFRKRIDGLLSLLLLFCDWSFFEYR